MNNYRIYALDDYSVHIMPGVKEAPLKRGYLYVRTGGGVTGDMQMNDTNIYASLKREYCKLEHELMISQLQSHPKKIPQSTRDGMMRMLIESLKNINADIPARYKAL